MHVCVCVCAPWHTPESQSITCGSSLPPEIRCKLSGGAGRGRGEVSASFLLSLPPFLSSSLLPPFPLLHWILPCRPVSIWWFSCFSLLAAEITVVYNNVWTPHTREIWKSEVHLFFSFVLFCFVLFCFPCVEGDWVLSAFGFLPQPRSFCALRTDDFLH